MKEKVFNPKVSIVIPVYNGADFLGKAIDSALNQTYKNIEILVINDGSNDNNKTEKLAKSYGNKIKYFYKENGGVATALNLGIKNMSGAYFSWLSHDDMYKKEKIENQINALSKLKEKEIIVSGSFEVVDEKDNILYTVDPFKLYKNEQLNNGLFSLMRGCINGCCLLIPKKYFVEFGLFNEQLLTTQDYDMFFRLFKNNSIIYLKTNDVLSRSHPNQGSKKLLDFHVHECNILWRKMIDTLSIEEMKRMEGNEYKFLFNTRNFLRKNTLYLESIEYIEKRIINIISKKLKSDFKIGIGYLQELLLEDGLKSDDINTIIYILKNFKLNNSICFILGNIDERGGLNRVVIKIANKLSNYYNVILISFTNGINGYQISNKINHILLKPSIMNNMKLIVKIIKLLDISIVVNSYNCSKRYLYMYKLFKEYNIKSIAWNHEFYYVPYSKIELMDCIKNRNELLNYADIVIWLNKYSYSIYSIFYNNAVYLPNPLIFEGNRVDYNSSYKNRLIAIGRFDDERKGLTELLKTFSIICSKRKNVVLQIIGSINLKENVARIEDKLTYQEYIKVLKIPPENLQIIGEVSNIEKFYEQSRINIMTSYNEGFGLVLLEAAEYGIPSVAFSGSAADDIIDNGENGFLVKYGDCNSLAEKVCTILDMDDNLYEELRKNVVNLSKKYSTDIIIDKWKILIEHLLYNTKLLKLKEAGFLPEVKYDYEFLQRTCFEYEENIKKILDEKSINIYDEDKVTKKYSYIKLCHKTIRYYRNNGFYSTFKKIKTKLMN